MSPQFFQAIGRLVLSLLDPVRTYREVMIVEGEMMARKFYQCGLLVPAVLLWMAGHAFASSIVINGSLEDPANNFADTSCNYMALSAGSTAITGWAVSASTPGPIVWGKSPTCDGYSASDGQFFLDLSGFGANSFDGTIQQQLMTTAGQEYSFSIDLGNSNNGAVTVMIDSDALTLSAGAAGAQWTPYSATFTALSSNPFLTIKRASAVGDIVFVDNVSIVASSSAVPEPASATLLGFGIATLGAFYHLTQRRKDLARL